MRKVSTLIIFSLFLFSCREEIIEPGNFAGNVNEPIQINDRNSFTFLINAQRFSMNLSVPASFNSSASRISITLSDHQSGNVFISVRDASNQERYSRSIGSEVILFTDILDGFVPNRIQIRTESLSGKLRIQLVDAF